MDLLRTNLAGCSWGIHKKRTQEVVAQAAAPSRDTVGFRKMLGLFGVGSPLGGRCYETVSSRLATAISINRYYMCSPLVCSGKVGDLHFVGSFLGCG